MCFFFVCGECKTSSRIRLHLFYITLYVTFYYFYIYIIYLLAALNLAIVKITVYIYQVSKGIVHPKMKIVIITLMSFQTRKTSVQLRNTNSDIFDEI